MTWSTSAVAVCCSSDCLQFVEQPRVLDGDNGLSGEVRYQGDLFVSKRSDFLTEQANRTDQFVFLQHWGGQTRPHAAKFDGCSVFGITSFALLCCIGDVSHRLRRDHEAKDIVRIGTNRRTPACLGISERRIMRRHEAKCVAIPAIDITECGVANANSVRQHGFKHRLKIAGGATDDLKHFRRRRLLL